jgi:hypothetical protein
MCALETSWTPMIPSSYHAGLHASAQSVSVCRIFCQLAAVARQMSLPAVSASGEPQGQRGHFCMTAAYGITIKAHRQQNYAAAEGSGLFTADSKDADCHRKK